MLPEGKAAKDSSGSPTLGSHEGGNRPAGSTRGRLAPM